MTMSKSFDELCNMIPGEIYWESCSLGNIQFKVKDKPSVEGDKVTWIGVCQKTGREIDYLSTKGFGHYGPSIYDSQQYFTREELRGMIDGVRDDGQ